MNRRSLFRLLIGAPAAAAAAPAITYEQRLRQLGFKWNASASRWEAEGPAPGFNKTYRPGSLMSQL